MKEYRRSSSYHRSGHKKSRSKDRDRDRDRDRERNKDTDRELHRTKKRRNHDERRSRDRYSCDADAKKRRNERTSYDRDIRSQSSRDTRSSWDHDRNGSSEDRDHYYYYNDKRHKSKCKISRHTKKSRHRRLSTSSSSSSSSVSSSNSHSSRNSRASCTSRNSYDNQLSKQLSRHRRQTRESSVDSKLLASKTLSKVITPKQIDLLDSKVQKALATIEEDTFVPGVFYKTKDREAPTSQRSSLPQENIVTGDKVIIDLNAETVTLPKPAETSTNLANNDTNEIIHPNFLGDFEQKQQKWIRKLYLYRQKYMKQ